MRNFSSFLSQLGVKPSPAHTIDRINNESGYWCGDCPECKSYGRTRNVRWVDDKSQRANRSVSIIIEFRGKKQNLDDWAEELGITRDTIETRFRLGWSVEKALATPVRPHKQYNSRDVPEITPA